MSLLGPGPLDEWLSARPTHRRAKTARWTERASPAAWTVALHERAAGGREWFVVATGYGVSRSAAEFDAVKLARPATDRVPARDFL